MPCTAAKAAWGDSGHGWGPDDWAPWDAWAPYMCMGHPTSPSTAALLMFKFPSGSQDTSGIVSGSPGSLSKNFAGTVGNTAIDTAIIMKIMERILNKGKESPSRDYASSTGISGTDSVSVNNYISGRNSGSSNRILAEIV